MPQKPSPVKGTLDKLVKDTATVTNPPVKKP